MFDLFLKEKMYVKVYKDEMEITDLRKNRTIRRVSSHKFSTDRMLIADYNAAEEHLKSILRELTGPGWLKRSIDFLIQYSVDFGGGMCEVEKRALRDVGEHGGGVSIFIILHTNELSNEQALKELNAALIDKVPFRSGLVI